MTSILIYFNIMINLKYLNAYHIMNFPESQDKYNDKDYLKNLKIKNINTLEQSDNCKVDNENNTE